MSSTERNRISTATGPILVSASAGSGKTYQLTQRFLHLLTETDTEIHQILAITYTDAAAAEMKNRIYAALIDAAEREADSDKREKLLRHRLRFSSNKISTIHSFCQSVLRENPEALASIPFSLDPFSSESETISLDNGFTLLDAYSEQALTPKWRAEFLQHYYDDEALGNWLATDSTYNLEVLLNKMRFIDDALLKNQAELSLDDWKVLVKNELRRRYDVFVAARKSFWDLAQHHMQIFAKPPTGLTGWEDWVQEVCGLKNVNKTKLKKEFKEQIPPELNEASIYYCETRDYFKNTLGIPVFELSSKPKDYYLSVIDPTSEERFGRLEYSAWQQFTGMAKCGLRWKSWLRFQRYKNSFIDHDDSIMLTGKLLQQFPAVARRYQMRFNHVMVDEFQDTDQTQWGIVKQLLNLRGNNSLLLVGDLKQAIYGFRGGEVSVMQKVTEDVKDFEKISLPASFRSNQIIVDLVNAIFRRLLPHEKDAKSYEAVYEKTTLPVPPIKPQAQQLIPGAVRYLHLDSKLWRDSFDGKFAERIDAESAHTWEAARVAYFLKSLRENPAPPAEWKRVADLLKEKKLAVGVLVRSRASIETWLRVFRQFGFTISATSGGKFFSKRELIDLYFLLSFLADRENEYALVGLMRSPWINLSDAGLLSLRLCLLNDEMAAHRKSWWTMLENGHWRSVLSKTDAAALDAVLPLLKSASNDIRFSRASDVVLKLLTEIPVAAGYDDVAAANAHLLRACRIMQEQELAGRAGLFELAEFFRINRDAESSEKETPSEAETEVQIMTIHKSKGLEFPCVVLADPGPRGGGGLELSTSPIDAPFPLLDKTVRLTMCRTIDENAETENERPYHPVLLKRIDELNAERERAELIRLFYVAITRAESNFIFVNHGNWTQENRKVFLSIWNGIANEVMEEMGLRKMNPLVENDWLIAGQTPFSAAEAEAILPLLENTERIQSEPFSTAIRDTVEANKERLKDLAKDAGRKPVKTTEAVKSEKTKAAFSAVEVDENTDDPRLRGTLVHRLIELALRGVPLSEELITRVSVHLGLAPVSGDSALKQAERAMTALNMRFPNARRFVTENAFLADFGGEHGLLNGVADLLVEDKNGLWWLVDYKTSVLTSGFASHAREAGYFAQLETYAKAYKMLFGAEIPLERQMLLFTHPETPVWTNALD